MKKNFLKSVTTSVFGLALLSGCHSLEKNKDAHGCKAKAEVEKAAAHKCGGNSCKASHKCASKAKKTQHSEK